MTTLTANSVRLPEHCEHKLPTSCRLTARPVCCACQDNRPHASSYSKYIDGVGFVPWGTRQERYCWPCKEFWDVRISISGLRTADTRLPEVPDLSVFLEEWYAWHQGYMVLKEEGGVEQRRPMVGESLSDCSHGYLPRTVQELRDGMQPGDRERLERGQQPQRPVAPTIDRPDDDFVVPEDERLFDEEPEQAQEASQDAVPTVDAVPSTSNIRQAAAAEHGHLAELAGDFSSQTRQIQGSRDQTRPHNDHEPLRIAREHYQRVTSLRRELQRMRQGIERVMSGLQSLQVDVPDSTEALDQLSRLSGSLSRYREAPLEIPELNNPDYQSPITGMFERAWRWHQQVQSDRMHALSAQDQPRIPPPPAEAHTGRETIDREIMARPRDGSPTRSEIELNMALQGLANRESSPIPLPTEPNFGPPHQGTSQIPYTTLMAEWRASRHQRMLLEAQRQAQLDSEQPSLGLDAPGRPPAIEDDEAFKIDNRCEVCLQQVATIATFPCGHMVMCQWCSDEVIPRHLAARNVPRDPAAKCPQCRRKVKHIYTVHVRQTRDYKENVKDREEDNMQKDAGAKA